MFHMWLWPSEQCPKYWSDSSAGAKKLQKKFIHINCCSTQPTFTSAKILFVTTCNATLGHPWDEIHKYNRCPVDCRNILSQKFDNWATANDRSDDQPLSRSRSLSFEILWRQNVFSGDMYYKQKNRKISIVRGAWNDASYHMDIAKFVSCDKLNQVHEKSSERYGMPTIGTENNGKSCKCIAFSFSVCVVSNIWSKMYRKIKSGSSWLCEWHASYTNFGHICGNMRLLRSDYEILASKIHVNKCATHAHMSPYIAPTCTCHYRLNYT